MAKTDGPVKRLVQLRPKDWIKLAIGCNEIESFSETKTEKNPKLESRLDNLYKVIADNKEFILNIEPQGYADKALSARMLRYRTDIYESLMSTDKKLLPIKQVVIYLSEDSEITGNTLIDDLFEHSRIDYSYDIIRIWKDPDKQAIIDDKLYGLYSLLPLMKDERKDDNKEKVFKESVQTVMEIEDEALRADILTGMSFLAEIQYPKNIIVKHIRRELLMKSELWKEWTEEERKEAMKIGEQRGEIRGEKRGEIRGRKIEKSNTLKNTLKKCICQVKTVPHINRKLVQLT